MFNDNSLLRRRRDGAIGLIAYIVFILAVFAVVTAIGQFLWNFLLIDLTGFKAVSFWQFVGLMVLGRIISGRFSS